MVNILRSGLVVLAICLVTINTDATDNKKNVDNKKIWENIFEVISSNTNTNPFDWLKKELGVTPLLVKGNRVPIKYNYYLTINYIVENDSLVNTRGAILAKDVSKM